MSLPLLNGRPEDRASKAYADADNDLILEHVLDTDGWLEESKPTVKAVLR